MRNTRIRTAAVAATALLATLSLTACQSDGDGKKAAVDRPATSAPTGEQAPADRAKDPGAKTPAGSKDKPGTSAEDGGGKTPAGRKGSAESGPVMTACTGANSKVTVTKVSRPLNHLLLTVTNTGSTACNAYHAPLLRFDDAQAVTAIMAESKPQAVVTLAPGESAYASILLASADGSGEGGYPAKTLTVHFAPRSGSGSTGSSAALTLPADSYTDSSGAVSYWQSSMEDALTY